MAAISPVAVSAQKRVQRSTCKPSPLQPKAKLAMDQAALSVIDCWIFDMDNTLYPADSGVFEQVRLRMGEFIADRFGEEIGAARARQKRHYLKHGTTMRGLMVEDGIDPHEFMDYVHDVDLSALPRNPPWAQVVRELPGRKFVYTNASTKHAARLLEHLGLAGDFTAIYDIEASGYDPKPNQSAYERLIALHGIDPTRAMMFEDMLANLAPAAALGMATVWLHGGKAPPPDGFQPLHAAGDLAEWLARLG